MVYLQRMLSNSFRDAVRAPFVASYKKSIAVRWKMNFVLRRDRNLLLSVLTGEEKICAFLVASSSCEQWLRGRNVAIGETRYACDINAFSQVFFRCMDCASKASKL